MRASSFELAQALDGSQSIQLLWLTLLLAAGLIFLGVVAMLLRRWINRRSEEESGAAAGGLGLSELRQMRAAGQLTQEEFDKAKQAVLKQMNLPAESPRCDPPA